MRSLVIGSFVFVSLVSLTLAAGPAQERDASKRVAELLEKLSSPKFADREQAMKELDSIGIAALPELRPALKSTDAEVRRRVETLVRKFEDLELTTKLLAAKQVRLNLKEATIFEAVAELINQSYSIDIPANLRANKETKITLDTGVTTFWQALHQIGSKISGSDDPAAKSAIDRAKSFEAYYTFPGKTLPAAATIPFGKSANLPVCFAGSIRITLVKTSPQLAAGIDVVLQVSGEPHLLDLSSAAGPTLDKAVDEQGQKLTAILVTDPIAPAKAAVAANLVIARAALPAPMDSQPRTGFQSFQVTLRLNHPAKQSKMLKNISGKIPVQTTVESEPSFVVDDILKAAGQTFKGKEGKALQVLEVSQLPKGEVMIKVAIESVNAQHPAAAAGVRIPAVQIQNGKMIQGNNAMVGWSGNGPIGVASALRLLDTMGRAFTQNAMPTFSFSFDGAKIIQTETILFTPQEGQDAPAKLVLPGYRPFCFEVPFSFKDVELNR